VPHILLIGAGFSHNWNGLLASEVDGALYRQLANDAELTRLLRESGNFEEALGRIQAEFRTQPTAVTRSALDRMQGAVLAVFNRMNLAFAEMPSMEFGPPPLFLASSVLTFLARFDAIFSLNQDLLLELHYNIELRNHQRWQGHQFPGMRPPPNWRGQITRDQLDTIWRPADALNVEPRLQPIFKLHGSVNWRDAHDGALLVMGTNKQATIGSKAILEWYRQQFLDYLTQPDTRLMIIGYGFSDTHINDAIVHASQTSGLRMYVVHPAGLQAWNRHPPGTIRPIYPLDGVGILGFSTRPISRTFANDPVSLQELNGFFVDA